MQANILKINNLRAEKNLNLYNIDKELYDILESARVKFLAKKKKEDVLNGNDKQWGSQTHD